MRSIPYFWTRAMQRRSHGMRDSAADLLLKKTRFSFFRQPFHQPWKKLHVFRDKLTREKKKPIQMEMAPYLPVLSVLSKLSSTRIFVQPSLKIFKWKIIQMYRRKLIINNETEESWTKNNSLQFLSLKKDHRWLTGRDGSAESTRQTAYSSARQGSIVGQRG